MDKQYTQRNKNGLWVIGTACCAVPAPERRGTVRGLSVLSLAIFSSANNVHAVPKAWMLPEHTTNKFPSIQPLVTAGMLALLD